MGPISQPTESFDNCDDAVAALPSIAESFADSTRRSVKQSGDFGLFSQSTMVSKNAKTSEDKQLLDILTTLSTHANYMRTVLEAKASLIADACAIVLRSKNWLATAHLVRGFMEVMGAIGFLAMRINDLLVSLESENSGEKAGRVIREVGNDVRRLYFGSSPFGTTGSIKAFKPHELLKRPFEPAVYASYELLCEFVHPNHGSNRLVSTGEFSAGYVSTLIVPPDEFLRVCNCLNDSLDLFTSKELQLLEGLVQIAVWLNRIPEMGLQRALAARKPKHKGDGKSKATAVSFVDARDQHEYAEWVDRYLIEQQIDLPDHHSLVEFDEDWVYRKYEVCEGGLWIKWPRNFSQA